eukprot:scaffold5296_cov105-Isochrysis_galbana.AAC.8
MDGEEKGQGGRRRVCLDGKGHCVIRPVAASTRCHSTADYFSGLPPRVARATWCVCAAGGVSGGWRRREGLQDRPTEQVSCRHGHGLCQLACWDVAGGVAGPSACKSNLVSQLSQPACVRLHERLDAFALRDPSSARGGDGDCRDHLAEFGVSVQATFGIKMETLFIRMPCEERTGRVGDVGHAWG